MSEVLAFDTYRTNAALIAACARLGYLRSDWSTLDPTFGYGEFWEEWRPDHLVRGDLNPTKSPDHPAGLDFRVLPYPDRHFDAVVFDPPYKLNGRPNPEDERYGVHVPARWQDRYALCLEGVAECARVARRFLLVKCQDQVCSGQVRFQTIDFAQPALDAGFRRVQVLYKLGGRPQPEERTCRPCGGSGTHPGEPQNDIPPTRCPNCAGTGRITPTQRHAAQNASAMVVLRRTGRV